MAIFEQWQVGLSPFIAYLVPSFSYIVLIIIRSIRHSLVIFFLIGYVLFKVITSHYYFLSVWQHSDTMFEEYSNSNHFVDGFRRLEPYSNHFVDDFHCMKPDFFKLITHDVIILAYHAHFVRQFHQFFFGSIIRLEEPRMHGALLTPPP